MNEVKTKSRILIVDDHPLVREGLTSRIQAQPDLEVCGEASGVSEAVDCLAANPDLVIVDILLAEGNGMELIKKIRERAPRVRILVVSTFDESLYAERALRAGAHGYINKRELQDSVLDAIRAVLAGGSYLSSKVTHISNGPSIHESDEKGSDPVERLSNRELEVFRLIGEGHATRAIADQLHLSIHTIDTHREKLRRKLGLKNGTELMQRAVQWVLENG